MIVLTRDLEFVTLNTFQMSKGIGMRPTRDKSDPAREEKSPHYE